MLTNAITVELRLPGLIVLEVAEAADRIEVAAEYADEEAVCPRCQQSTWRVHQRRRQRKRDAQLWGKQVWIVLWKRRFRCRPCRYVFTEDDPACGRRKRTTRRLRGEVALQAQEASVKAVSRWHGVSEGLVQRSWLESYTAVTPPSRPHVFLGVDGFCVRRPGVMWTGLWDIQTRRPVAVLKGERSIDVQRLLERHASRDSVKAVVMDLSEAERQAVHMALPQSLIVADKFHVVALVHRALQEVRGGRRLPGNDAWLMHRNVERLRPEEGERLAKLLLSDPRLATAWLLKEGVRGVYRKRTQKDAADALAAWLKEAQESGLKPFQRRRRP